MKYLRRGCLCFLGIIILFVIITLLQKSLDNIKPEAKLKLLNEECEKSQLEIQKGVTNSENRKTIPKLLHRIYGIWDTELSPAWRYNLFNSCREVDNQFRLVLWNRTSILHLLNTHYPWFVKTYESYQHPVQKADSARYFILYHYGGMYLDMDVKCFKNTSLSNFHTTISKRQPDADAVLLSTDPLPVTPLFIAAKSCSNFMRYLVSRLEVYNRWYGIPYVTVMFSTGPGFISNSYKEFILDLEVSKNTNLWLLPQFQFWNVHFQSNGAHGTWHEWDAKFLLFFYIDVYFNIKSKCHKRFSLCFALFVFVMFVLLFVFYKKCLKCKR